MSWLLSTRRRVVQALSLVLLNSNFWGMGTESVCLPIMNCEACAIAWLGCPIGMIGSNLAFREWPLLVLGMTLVVGALVGRFLCGWVCPMGFLQDLIYKIPSLKFRLPRWATWIKYGFLVGTVFVLGFFFGKEPDVSPFFFCNFCPTAAIQVVLPDMIAYQDYALTFGRSLRLGVLVAVLLISLGVHRGFCKVMCPVGALIAIANRFSFLSLRLNKSACVSCSKCDKSCPMDVPVMSSPEKGRAVNRDSECIECLTCQQSCPTAAITTNSRVLK
ncbi:MAG: 4Fe-4S binding protein [Verrucomicrobia bacterium]|jgi:ferredoxin-type protein NapH|nr:4Fe-4S binding protein [Verrucomicrobiota bacterium]